MRLIDADALIEDAFNLMDRNELLDDVPQIIKDYCDAQPTIDAVPAIRCKNCRHMICTASIEHNDGEVKKYYMCNYWHRPTDDDGYCHVAERKDCDAKRKS